MWQDKTHCPFYFKTGVCRYGQECKRLHYLPDKSHTLLMKNMYSGPGLAWEQDEGLEVCKQCLHVPLYPVILTAAFFFHCLRIPETILLELLLLPD